MLLEPDDLALLFKLHKALMLFVVQRLKLHPQALTTPQEFARLPVDARFKARDALLENLDLIDSFCDLNPAGFSQEELAIVRSWRFLIKGKFIILRNLAKYTVFLSDSAPPIGYGVVALSQPFEEMIQAELPVMVETVLLPFKGRIIYDALLNRFNILFGPGYRSSMKESFKEAKARPGIITSLPMPNEQLPLKSLKSKPAPKPPSKGGKDDVLQVILGMIDQFSKEHLNEEYAVLCRKMTEKLARKRPSPLLKGSPNAWASGIVRAVGMVNFLHDKSRDPYMRTADIDRLLGASPSSAAARMAEIKKLLGLRQFHHEWTLPSAMEDNPLIWMLSVNGLMMDVRDGPRDLQEAAFRKGLIPYIPADR